MIWAGFPYIVSIGQYSANRNPRQAERFDNTFEFTEIYTSIPREGWCMTDLLVALGCFTYIVSIGQYSANRYPRQAERFDRSLDFIFCVVPKKENSGA